MEIKWKRGEFQKFWARIKVRIGGGTAGAAAVAIQAGDEFEYDGSILKYAGAEIVSPQARGMIKEDWVTSVDPSEDGVDTDVPAFVPNRNIAKATSVNRDLSRVSRGTDQMQTDSLDEETVLNVSDRRPDAKSNQRANPRVMTASDNRRGMPVTNGIENQEGVTVGRVRTAAKHKTDVLSGEIVEARKQIAEMSGSGFIPNQERTVHKEGVTIKSNVGRVNPAVNLSQDDEGTVVGQVRKTKTASSGDIEITDTSNIRSDRAKAAQAKPANGQPKAEPVKAAPVKIDTSVNPKIRAARRIDPTFPASWEFSGKLAERLERAKKHGATPTFLEALWAAEGDPMRKLLEKTFPKQFGG